MPIESSDVFFEIFSSIPVFSVTLNMACESNKFFGKSSFLKVLRFEVHEGQ